jgi:putative membrane protein
VLGIIIGYVPIEEYAFFVVQTLFSGLLFGWFLISRDAALTRIDSGFSSNAKMRIFSAGMLLIIWFTAIITFIIEIESLIYLNLIILWAIPPIVVQLLYGADILWGFKRDLVLVIVLSTIYLAAADAIAILNGIWTISSNTSTGILLGGILPIEEFIFFLVTNVLITFGLTLIINSKSRERFNKLKSRLKEPDFRV